MSPFLKIWFFLGDLLLLNLSILISLHLYGGAVWIGAGVNNVYFLTFSNLGWLFLVLVSNPYSVVRGWSVTQIIRSQFAFVFIHLLLLLSLVILFKQNYSVSQVGLIYIIFIPSFLAYRVLTFYLRKVWTNELPFKNYVLIGRNELSSEIRKFFLINPASGYKFKGYLELRPDEASIAYIREYCVTHDVHEICCCDLCSNHRSGGA